MARNLTVGFGLLTINTKSDVATIAAPEMKNLCPGQPGEPAHEPTPVTAPTTCVVCGPVIDRDVLVKGVSTGGGTYAVVSQEDIADARASYGDQYKKRINLVPHDAATFDAATAPGKTMHYLTPADAASADHYQLMVALISRHPELAFVGLHTPVSATSLYRVTVREGVLVMQARVREGSMKPAPSVGGSVNEQFLAMLEASLPMLTTPYDAAGYEDQYAAKVAALRDAGDIVGGTVGATVASDDALMAQFAALAAG